MKNPPPLEQCLKWAQEVEVVDRCSYDGIETGFIIVYTHDDLQRLCALAAEWGAAQRGDN